MQKGQTHAQSSSFPSSPPGRRGCPPRRRCSGPACRPSACSNLRSRLQSSTRHRRRGRSSAVHSAHQSARPGTSPRRSRVSSWSPDGSLSCSDCLQRRERVTTRGKRLSESARRIWGVPVYSVGDSAFHASMINENVPLEKHKHNK